MEVEVIGSEDYVKVRVVVNGREYVSVGPSNDPGSLLCVLVLQMVRGGEGADAVAEAVKEAFSRIVNQSRQGWRRPS